MDAEITKNSFELDGKTYELPELRELDIDEWMVVYKYSKVVLRDLMPIIDDPQAEHDRIEKLEQPGLMKALFHIAYQRAHPKKTTAAVETLVGQIKYLPTLEAMDDGDDTEEVAEDDDPPTLTPVPESEPSEPEPSSPNDSDSQSENGSSSSQTSSGIPEVTLVTTGTSG